MYKDKKNSASKIKSVSDTLPPSQEDCLIKNLTILSFSQSNTAVY